MRLEPVGKGRIDARLPTGSGSSKSLQYIQIKAHGDELFSRRFLCAALPAQSPELCNASMRDGLRPIHFSCLSSFALYGTSSKMSEVDFLLIFLSLSTGNHMNARVAICPDQDDDCSIQHAKTDQSLLAVVFSIVFAR